MQIKPILFNTQMTKAILRGDKKETRRIVSGLAGEGDCDHGGPHEFVPDDFGGISKRTGFVCGKCGYGVCPPRTRYAVGSSWIRPFVWPGDFLYVRETWTKDTGRYLYRADYLESEKFYRNGQEIRMVWRPSIHMPREAARIFLQVTDVRIERLQQITEEDARKEGVERGPSGILPYTSGFIPLWESTIQKGMLAFYGWDANPYVWVYAFERCEKPEEKDNDPV